MKKNLMKVECLPLTEFVGKSIYSVWRHLQNNYEGKLCGKEDFIFSSSEYPNIEYAYNVVFFDKPLAVEEISDKKKEFIMAGRHIEYEKESDMAVYCSQIWGNNDYAVVWKEKPKISILKKLIKFIWK